MTSVEIILFLCCKMIYLLQTCLYLRILQCQWRLVSWTVLSASD